MAFILTIKNLLLRKAGIHSILLVKAFTILFLIIGQQLSAYTYAQNVTLSEKNASLQSIFIKLHAQTGYQFFIADDLLDKAGKVTIDVQNVNLKTALDKCFEHQPLVYEMDKKTIVVKYKFNALPKTITGRVLDENGQPQIGVAVTVKGTSRGTATDINGNYSIEDVEDTDILVFSAINLEQVELEVGNKVVMNLTMKARSSLLDEVQIVGYQTTTKRLKTSSVSSIKSRDLQIQPVVNPILALQGSIAGLSITNSSGAVGGNSEILIRGVATLQSGNQPLVIVDGAIIPNTTLSGINNNISGAYVGLSGVSPFNIINPNDIESIEVLKDADATAIYGSRGTNGVILINTKKAKLGTAKFNVEASTGINEPAVLPRRMNTQQYLEMRRDAFAMGNYNSTTKVAINPITVTPQQAPDLLSWDQNQYTDWNAFEFNNPAKVYNLQGNISGGAKELSYYASVGFSRNEDITIGNPFQERFSGLINLNHTSANDKFSLKLSSNFSNDRVVPSRGSVSSGASLHALPPNMPLRDAEGGEFWPSPAILPNTLLTNPFAGPYVNILAKTSSYIGNIEASYNIFKGLQFKTQFGFSTQTNDNFNTTPSKAINPLIPGQLIPNRNESVTKFQSINIEPQLIYNTQIGKGDLNVLLGGTFFDRTNSNFSILLEGFASDLLLGSWAAATTVTSRNSSEIKYRFNSTFGRIGYNWDQKYIINATFRRDGSSRFGPDNKFGNFGSVGAAWIFTNEKFISKNLPWLSFGKLRSSYGVTGNDNINEFRYTSLFASTNIQYGPNIGSAPLYLSNPSFRWESTTKFDAAIELGFLKDRILLTVNRFRNLSTDLLTDQRVPTTTGFGTYITNFPGVIENKGWEFEVTSNNLPFSKAFQWKTSFNVTLLKNTLLEYPNLESSANSNTLAIGQPVGNPRFPINLSRTWVFEGVDPATGLPKFKDVNGDGVISTSGFTDREFIGTSIPRTYGGITNTFSYKGFSLDVFIQFSQQMVTNHLYLARTPGQLYNPVEDVYGNYWKQPGDVSKYPRLTTGISPDANTRLITDIYYWSTAAVDDVVYARLKNLALTYSVPSNTSKKLGMSNINIFARGQNLFTWVSKPIFKDPEIVFQRGTIPMTIIGGFNLTF